MTAVEQPALGRLWLGSKLLAPVLECLLWKAMNLAILPLICAFRRSRPLIPDEAGRLYRLKPAGQSDDAGRLVGRALVSTCSSGQLALSSSSF
jgi:hypothetical protein